MSMAGLSDRVAVVAGAGSGIGAVTALRLGAEGCRVIAGDVVELGAQRTAEAIIAAGGEATHTGFDLAEPDSVERLFELAAEWGGAELLFNVGADMNILSRDTDVVDIELDTWDRVMTVTLRGYLLTMKHAIPQMLTAGRGGAIVNVSSAAAFQGEPVRPAYATAKAGIGALTRHVASRWGGQGIRCNAVAPGFTATAAMRAAPQWPDLQSKALRRMRSNRVGEPRDVAALVAFLLSDEGEWINGQVLNVDGGTILR